METSTIDIYDGLIKLGVRDPAVFKLGDRHIIGAWEELNVMEMRDGQWYVLRSGKKAVRVYGDAASWKESIDQAGRYLPKTDPAGSKTSDTFPSSAVFVSGISL